MDNLTSSHLLVSAEDQKLIFQSLTRDKTGNNIGLTYNDFLQSLLRTSVKSQFILNRISDNSTTSKKPDPKSPEKSKVDQVRDVVNKAKQEFGLKTLTQAETKAIQNGLDYNNQDVDNNKEDEYKGIGDLRRETLEGLLIYLDLPTDQVALKDKLKGLRTENQKVVAPRDKKRGNFSHKTCLKSFSCNTDC